MGPLNVGPTDCPETQVHNCVIPQKSADLSKSCFHRRQLNHRVSEVNCYKQTVPPILNFTSNSRPNTEDEQADKTDSKTSQ
jgi:hypothetical protein